MKTTESHRPAELTLSRIGGRWKIPIFFHLRAGAQRFSELCRAAVEAMCRRGETYSGKGRPKEKRS